MARIILRHLFRHVTGPIAVLLTFATLLAPFVAIPARAQDTGNQATLGSGTVVTWQAPWGDPFIEPNSVNLVTAEGTVFNVKAFPVSEESPEAAAAETPCCDYSVLDEGVDANGGYYHISYLPFFDPLTGQDIVFLAYGRAWASADGQWTILTQLQSKNAYFHRDLVSIPQTIMLDDTPLWTDIDADAITASLEQATGQEFPLAEGAAVQESTPGGEEPTGGAQSGNEFESVNGTVFAYPADWSADPSMSAPDGIQLQAGDATLVLGDMAEDQDGETLFNDLTSTLPQIVDQGPTPDGGYYGLAYGQDNGGRNFYILFRFLHAAGTGTPVVVMLAAPTDTFGESLTLAHGVTANGQSVLEGLDDAVTLATLEGGGPTGEPVFTGGQASDPVPTEEPAPSAVGTEIEAPSGTLISWTEAWTYEQLEGMPASIVILYGVEAPASLMIAEGVAGQGVVEMWAEFSSTGGEVIDEGETPDGGYYSVSLNEADPVFGGSPSYTLVRAYAADTAPIIVILTISGTDFAPSLAAARDVTTDGVSLLEGVDDAALIATFENGGPTGEAIFTGGEPGATTGGEDEPGNSGGESRRDIIGNGDQRGPSGLPDLPGASQESDASYTSKMLDYTLAWDDSWAPDESSSEVNEDDGYDYFVLEAQHAGPAWFNLVGMEWDESDDVDDIIESWTTDEFIEDVFAEGTEVVLVDSRRNSGAVVYVGPAIEDDPELWVTIFELVNVDDELRLEPTLLVPLSDFEEVYEDATESITVDGDEVFGYFSTEEIMEVLPEE